MTSFTPLPTMVSHMGLHGFPVHSGTLSHAGLDRGATIAAMSHVNSQQLLGLPMLSFDGLSTNLVDARTSLALKMKGGFTLAGFAKNSNKFSPY
jgi:hypothetical protein